MIPVLFLFFLRYLKNLIILARDVVISFGAVRYQTAAAVLDAVVQILEISPAGFSQAVQRAVAEKTVKRVRIFCVVTREILALFILKKFIMFAHFLPPSAGSLIQNSRDIHSARRSLRKRMGDA